MMYSPILDASARYIFILPCNKTSWILRVLLENAALGSMPKYVLNRVSIKIYYEIIYYVW